MICPLSRWAGSSRNWANRFCSKARRSCRLCQGSDRGPEIPKKVEAGNLEDIVPCTACLTCWDTLERGEPLRCRVNPSVGREDEFKIAEAAKKKRVMVVGGGPAGMACARVAAHAGS